MVISKSISISNLNNKKCKYNKIFLFIGSIISIIIFLIIISSMTHLENLSNCDCANLPYRKYIKEWFSFLIFFNVAILVLFYFSNEKCYEDFMNYPIINFSYMIVSLISIIMIIRLYLYMESLRNNCKCAYGIKEKFLYWFSLIEIILLVTIIFFALVLLILTIFSLLK